ncbi:MAG: S9 family peptidase, partial [Brevundimonas sp.]
MRLAGFVSALALMAAVRALAVAAEPPAAVQTAAPTYTAAQFFETTSYGMANSAGRAFSPDGRSILISSDATGVFNTYAQPVAGGAPVPLTTSTTSSASAVSFFPHDGRVLFSQDGGGDELTHIFARAEDGAITDVTPGENLKAEFVGWNRDGKTFYVITNGRDPAAFDLIAVDAATYEHRTVFENTGGFQPAALSPDGRWLVLDKALTSANNDLYIADLTQPGEPRLLTRHTGDVAYTAYDFTPDSKALLIGTDEHGEFTQAYRHDLETGAVTPVIQADWDVQYVFYSPSGRYRVSALNADAKTELTLLDTTTNAAVPMTGLPEGDIGSIRFNDDETRLAFTVASDTSPSDIFTADLATGQTTRLTHALNPAIDEDVLVEATVVRYPGEGGVMVPAVLYKPRGASATNPAPAIVLVHGGPGGQTRRGYSAMIQHLVNHGYAVLGANNRGSSGYGKTFFHMDDKKHGEADLRDIVAGGEWLRQPSPV